MAFAAGLGSDATDADSDEASSEPFAYLGEQEDAREGVADGAAGRRVVERLDGPADGVGEAHAPDDRADEFAARDAEHLALERRPWLAGAGVQRRDLLVFPGEVRVGRGSRRGRGRGDLEHACGEDRVARDDLGELRVVGALRGREGDDLCDDAGEGLVVLSAALDICLTCACGRAAALVALIRG